MPNKFLYQNQQQTPDTSHFTLTHKSFHTSLSPSNRFYQIRLQCGSMTKHFVHKNKQILGRRLYIPCIHQKYIITHTVHTRVLNVSFLYIPVRVPAG